MKNVLILGTGRAGKTTLAKMIHKECGHSLISAESLLGAFQTLYSQIGMRHDVYSDKLLTPFVAEYIKGAMYSHPGCLLVVEGYHIHPQTAKKLIGQDEFEIIVLGCPSLTPKQALINIRKNDDKTSWTKSMSDDFILNHAKNHISQAKDLQIKCEKLNIPFYDTSSDRDKILSGILEKIKNG